jgi:archaellum component FlaC
MDDKNLLEAKYTAPSGKEFIFLWENALSKTTELKTGTFTFPDRDGAHVQHQGGGAVSFPMTCIFNGDGHVKKADEFEAALLEKDIAELQHPVYGIIKVIPTGNISRSNDLINSINESHVTITFTETITDDPVKLEAVTADKLMNDFDEFAEAAAADFAENLSIDNISEQLLLQSILETQSDLLNENLGGIASNSPNFLTAIKELKNNIKSIMKKREDLTVKALNVARLTLHITKIPSRLIININEKIKGYSLLKAQITSQFKNDPFGINNIKNSFLSTRLFLTGAAASFASGMALSIATNAANSRKETSGGASAENAGAGGTAGGANAGSGARINSGGSGVLSRESAVEVALQLKEYLNAIQEFEDEKIEKNNFIDANANTYLLLNQLVYNSINLILNVSFSLPMRRTIKLETDRNFIELCAELYGSVDNYYLDKLIIENNLNIDDLEIIPMGREVSYYV